MSNNASGEGSLDDSRSEPSIQSMFESQPAGRIRRRSLSMLEMNEMESIKKIGPITDHYIKHDHNSDITITGMNGDGIKNNCDEIRSISMLEMNETESIKKICPITDHYIDHNSDVTITGMNGGGIKDNCDQIYASNSVTIYFDKDDDENDKFTFGSEERASVSQSMTSSVSSDEQTNENSLSSQDRKASSNSILKSSISSNTTPIRSHASFSTLEIREYPTTLGDNPGGVQGPPISLDWNYSKGKTQIIALEDYEKTRLPRRKRADLRMNGNIRTWMLLRERGFTLSEINKATKTAESARLQRKKSTQSGPISNLKKRLKRIASRKN